MLRLEHSLFGEILLDEFVMPHEEHVLPVGEHEEGTNKTAHNAVGGEAMGISEAYKWCRFVLWKVNKHSS